MNPTPNVESLLRQIKAKANPNNLAGMQRFGIRGQQMLGVGLYEIRGMVKGVHDHQLALDLWQTGIHEARIMASIVDEPARVTRDQLNAWVKDFDSWDVCDQVTTNLVDISPFAIECIFAWANQEPEYIRRAGFATLAGLAVHNKTLPDSEFEPFFTLIKEYSSDERNFVKKAVNWALRNIGKRNKELCLRAMEVAEEIKELDNRTSRWIAADALRELKIKFEKMK
jgi:3-methyladenine DNA glycosylase AlkD